MQLSSKIWLQNAPWTISLWRKTPRVLGHTGHFLKLFFRDEEQTYGGSVSSRKKSFLCNKWQSVFGWHPGKLVRLYLKQHDTQGALTFISCPRLQKVSKQTDSSVSGVGWLTCCRHLGPHHVTHSPSPRHWATALLDVGERGYCPWGPVGVSFKSHLPWLPERALTASSTGASTLKKELLGALQENASSVVSIYPLSTELSSENIHAYTGT